MMLRHLSLTTRLTLFFTLVVTSVVFGLVLLVMPLTDRHFIELDQAALSDKKLLVEQLIGHAGSVEDLKNRLDEALAHHHSLYVQIRTRAAEVVYFYGHADLAGPGVATEAMRDGQVLLSWRSGEAEFRGLHFEASAAYAPAGALDVLVAVATAHHDVFFTQLQRGTLVYAALAIGIGALLSWAAAHHGMAPLRAMRQYAATVSARELDARMPVETVPAEMASLAQELNQMLERLQRGFVRLSDFSSDLAHELRTPLSNLLTQTQVVLSARREASAYREALASNVEELQRMARMVSDMLLLAQTEHGAQPPMQEHFSAHAEVMALFDFYEATAQERHVLLRVQGETPIFANRSMVRRAISNLLSNALRHARADSEVLVVLTSSDRFAQVVVENTGDTIDPKSLPRLFDRFYRADAARLHTESGGTGLGLPITRAIAQAHGGRVTVESVEGKTRFHLLLPRQPLFS